MTDLQRLDELDEHVVAIDAECSCGETIKGAWSGEEVDAWHESHRLIVDRSEP